MDASSYTQQDQQQARWGYDPTLSPDIQLELEADLMSQAQNGEYNLQAYADAGPSSSHVQFTASNEFGSGNTPADAFSSIPLPPSQPPSHRPSRANSRSSSLTRSPPLPLDHSHVGGGGQHTAQTFPSFAQYAAFLTTDGGAQPAEYGAPRPTYNFSHTQAQGQGQPPSPPNFTVAGAQFAPGPGAIDTSSGHYVHGHGQQYPRSSGSGHYPTSSGSAHYPTSSGSAHYPTQQAKRKRMTQPGAEVHDSRDGDEMDFEDDGHSGGGGGQHGGGGQGGGGGSGGVVKPSGACARCKTLKVKCEFVTGANGGEADSCKRCANGGHECVVPGRKKRKSPPKREHLLTQIREQAAQIQKLMSQLERPARGGGQHQGQFLNAQQHPHHSQQHGQRAGGQHAQQHAQFRMPTSASASEISFASLHSPILSPTSAGAAGYDGGAQLSQIPPPPTTKAEADVAAWLAKARGSLAEFDGLLGATPVLQGYLVAGDDSDHSSDDGDYHHYDYDDEHDPDLNDLDDMDYANGGGGYGARARDDVDSEDSEFEIEVLDAAGNVQRGRGRRNRSLGRHSVFFARDEREAFGAGECGGGEC
ncbi:hypothetical protein C8R43DRAFT_443958 [Mycena crocata]|nr:hypothetical protein C8R43DRAFT_443958 [Mycena crocata]